MRSQPQTTESLLLLHPDAGRRRQLNKQRRHNSNKAVAGTSPSPVWRQVLSTFAKHISRNLSGRLYRTDPDLWDSERHCINAEEVPSLRSAPEALLLRHRILRFQLLPVPFSTIEEANTDLAFHSRVARPEQKPEAGWTHLYKRVRDRRGRQAAHRPHPGRRR